MYLYIECSEICCGTDGGGGRLIGRLWNSVRNEMLPCTGNEARLRVNADGCSCLGSLVCFLLRFFDVSLKSDKMYDSNMEDRGQASS